MTNWSPIGRRSKGCVSRPFAPRPEAITSFQRAFVRRAASLALAWAFVSVGCVHEETTTPAVGEISFLQSTEVRSDFGMIATGAADASRVGAEILEQGGNAIDAAVAAAFVLAVVDPADSGLGGMTMALVRLADGRSVAIEGACVVPLRFDAERLAALKESDVKTAIEFAAVPGSLAALDHLARVYGSIPIRELITPAIEIAEDGFTMSEFQIFAIQKYMDRMLASTYLRFTVLENGTDLPGPGDRIFRPCLKHALEVIAERGHAEFYQGSLASKIHDDMEHRGGFVTRSDLGIVRARETDALRGTYRGLEVLSFPSPGGGETVIHTLNILERFPSELLAAHSLDRLQLMLDALRISRSDGSRHRSRPDRPLQYRDLSFLEKDYASQRASMIEFGTALPEDALPKRSECPEIENQTTHLSVIDRWGNTVSMTQSLGNFYGAQTMNPDLGIPYNNLLAGGCHPTPREIILCDMAPTIVVQDGRPILAVGTAGSSRIPGIVATVISNIIDGGAGPGEAIDAPRTLWGGKASQPTVEVFGPVTWTDIDALSAMGYQDLRLAGLPGPRSSLAIFGGVNAVFRDPQTGTLVGVADARRLGVAQGARF